MLCLWRGVDIFINLSKTALGWFQPSISCPKALRGAEHTSICSQEKISLTRKARVTCLLKLCMWEGKQDVLSWSNQCSMASFIRVGSHGGLIPSAHQMCWFLTFCMSGQKGNKSSLDHWAKACNEIKTQRNCCFVLYSLSRISLICCNFNYFSNSSCHLLSNISSFLMSSISSWMHQKKISRFSGSGYVWECIGHDPRPCFFSKRNHNYHKYGMHSLEKSKPPLLLMLIISKACQLHQWKNISTHSNANCKAYFLGWALLVWDSTVFLVTDPHEFFSWLEGYSVDY